MKVYREIRFPIVRKAIRARAGRSEVLADPITSAVRSYRATALHGDDRQTPRPVGLDLETNRLCVEQRPDAGVVADRVNQQILLIAAIDEDREVGSTLMYERAHAHRSGQLDRIGRSLSAAFEHDRARCGRRGRRDRRDCGRCGA